MAGMWARSQAQERVTAVGAAGLDASNLRIQVLDVLRTIVGFDAHVWLLTDPVTTVGASPLAGGPCLPPPPALPELIKAKYGTPVNRWTALLQPGASPVGLLHEAIDHEPARSRVWRDMLRRYRIGDVASMVLADHFGCWGFLDLWRDDTHEPFDRSDAEFLAGLAAPLTTALRACQARTFVEAATPHRRELGPVVLTLDDDLRITSRTVAAQDWLNTLLPPVPDERAVPANVYNVAAQLSAVEDGVDDHPAWARGHLADGFWLTMRAARLASDAPTQPAPDKHPATIVVTIEEASAAERLEVFSRAFGLSTRESQIVGLLAIGDDTRAMARRTSLSEFTIQDHLKSIFNKTGARDRVTVLSRALGTQLDATDLAAGRLHQ